MIALFLKKYWKELFIAIIIALFLFKYHAMGNQIMELEKEKSVAELQAKEYKATIEGLGEYMTIQNNAVLDLQALSDTQDTNLKQAEIEADKIEESYKEKIRNLLQESVPIGCDESFEWMLNKSTEGEFKWSK